MNSKFLKGIVHALRGFTLLIAGQRNARIELAIALIVVAFSFWLQISKYEWLAVLACIALVLSLEALNTAIETLADKIHPEHDQQIGRCKDIAAAAVLIASIVASIIGIIIFAPLIMDIFISK